MTTQADLNLNIVEKGILKSLHYKRDMKSNGDEWEWVNIDDILPLHQDIVNECLSKLMDRGLVMMQNGRVKLSKEKVSDVECLLEPHLVLHGSRSGKTYQNEERIIFMTNMLGNTRKEIEQIERIRTQHVNFTLVLMAAALAFGAQIQPVGAGLVIFIILFFMIRIFWRYDTRLHRISHAHRKKAKRFERKIADMINWPEIHTVYWNYYNKGEVEAEAESKQRKRYTRHYIYLLLMRISIILFSIGVIAILGYGMRSIWISN